MTPPPLARTVAGMAEGTNRLAAAEAGPASGEPLPERLVTLNRLLKLHNRLMTPFSTHLEKRHRITLNEFRVLMMVGEIGATASHELAVMLGVNTMAISRAVGALGRQGRIEATVDPASRRRKILRLTDAGEQLYREMLPASLTVADYLFEALRPHELMTFDHFIQVLLDQLEAVDADGRSVFLERTSPQRLGGGS